MMNSKKIFSSNKVPLTKLDMKILKILCESEYSQGYLAEKCNSSVGGVAKALKRLGKYGLVYCLKDCVQMFILVPDRKHEVENFLSGYDFGKNAPCIVDAHSFIFECTVAEFSKKFEKALKKTRWIEYNPKNYKGYKRIHIDGSVLFHKTKKRTLVRFYFKTFAESPEIAEMINIEKFMDRKKLLEEEYPGLQLGGYHIVAKCSYQHVALLKDPLSVVAIKLGIKHKNIEDSHRIGGEWEEKGIDAVEKISKLIKIREKELNWLNEREQGEVELINKEETDEKIHKEDIFENIKFEDYDIENQVEQCLVNEIHTYE